MTARRFGEPPPQYDLDLLVDTWLRQTEAHPAAMAVERLARYAPELGWPAILAVVERPDARPHFWSLERALRMLVARHGPAFIDRMEAEAARNPAFRELLQHLDSDPVFRTRGSHTTIRSGRARRCIAF